MNRLAAVLRETGRTLDRLRRPWALVGGMAVAVRAEPRMTRDVDVAVVVADDPDAEALCAAMMQRGYQTFESLEHRHLGRLATMRLVAPGEGLANTVVDLLFASCGIEPEVVAGAKRERIIGELVVPVVQRGHLMAMKTLADRPRDVDDFGHLLHYAEPADLDLARQSLDLIMERGFSRTVDLRARFEELVERGPSRL